MVHGMVFKMKHQELIAYWAPTGFADQLGEELSRLTSLDLLLQKDELFLCTGEFAELVWAQSSWRNCQRQTFQSINDSVKILRPHAKKWIARSIHSHRRSQLISAKLRMQKPHVLSIDTLFSERTINQAGSTLGGFSLLNATEVLFSNQLWSEFNFVFGEDKRPPSRAYRKLLELIWRFDLKMRAPEKNSYCLDLGASPGGWTWLLVHLGWIVKAFDRSPLHPSLMKHPRVEFAKRDMFSLRPEEFEHARWLFCDTICYPKKLIPWLSRWLENSQLGVGCTIKFQGHTDFEAIAELKNLKHCQLVHLIANKHELTLIRPPTSHVDP